MTKVLKTTSELNFGLSGYTQDVLSGAVELTFEILNPYIGFASLSSFKYKAQGSGEWLNATLMSEQKVDVDNIQLTTRNRMVVIRWDAAQDLRIMQAFTDVEIAIELNDRAQQSGTPSELKEFSLSSVDLRSQAEIKMVRPKANDPYMEFVFTVPVPPRQAKINFLIEVDITESFDSSFYLSFHSYLDQTGWSIDGASFPAPGVDGIGMATGDRMVSFTHNDLSNLSSGTQYYYRVVPILDQFLPFVDNISDGQVIIGTLVDISGTVEVYD